MQWAEYKRIFGGGNGWISGGSVYGSGLCYEDAEELQLGAGQLVFRGLELMFTVVFFLLVVWFQFGSVMKCGGVVVLRWNVVSAGNRGGVSSFSV